MASDFDSFTRSAAFGMASSAAYARGGVAIPEWQTIFTLDYRVQAIGPPPHTFERYIDTFGYQEAGDATGAISVGQDAGTTDSSKPNITVEIDFVQYFPPEQGGPVTLVNGNTPFLAPDPPMSELELDDYITPPSVFYIGGRTWVYDPAVWLYDTQIISTNIRRFTFYYPPEIP